VNKTTAALTKQDPTDNMMIKDPITPKELTTGNHTPEVVMKEDLTGKTTTMKEIRADISNKITNKRAATPRDMNRRKKNHTNQRKKRKTKRKNSLRNRRDLSLESSTIAE
jgi:hypothetical protein